MNFMPCDDHDHSSHSPAHGHSHAPTSERRVAWALGLTLSLTFVEFFGGWWTNSLALMADAGHMLSDAAALGATWWALRRRNERPTPQRTFGARRAEILVALFNSATLLLVGGGILHEAWERLYQPAAIKAGPMLAIAVAGLVVNVAGLWLLHDHKDESLNLEGAWQHIMGDAAGSVCAILAAIGVLLGGWTILDVVASTIVTLLILYSAIGLMRRTISVLMEHAPDSIDVAQVQATLLGTAGVRGVHCLHVWTIGSDCRALSAHVVHEPGESSDELLDRLHERLGATYPLEHVTLQLEPVGYTRCHGDADWCRTDIAEPAPVSPNS
jgi:cobalt-zinc-cadmium efflux system protein